VLIVDSQIHVWEGDRPERPWPPDGRSFAHRLDNPMSVEEALAKMDAAGVAGAILVPPSFEGNRNDLVGNAVRTRPDRFAAIGRIAVDVPWTPAQIKETVLANNLVGLRMTFLRENIKSQLREGQLEWFWRAAEDLDIPITLLGPDVVDQFEVVANAHPGLRMIVDHLNLIEPLTFDALATHMARVCQLSRYDNVAVKASALPCYVDESYPFPRLGETVYRVVEAFGSNRVFWGSDISRLTCPYWQWRDFFLNELTDLDSDEKTNIMGAGLVRWLGLSFS
jgi:L-fuconolactonase